MCTRETKKVTALLSPWTHSVATQPPCVKFADRVELFSVLSFSRILFLLLSASPFVHAIALLPGMHLFLLYINTHVIVSPIVPSFIHFSGEFLSSLSCLWNFCVLSDPQRCMLQIAVLCCMWLNLTPPPFFFLSPSLSSFLSFSLTHTLPLSHTHTHKHTHPVLRLYPPALRLYHLQHQTGYGADPAE